MTQDRDASEFGQMLLFSKLESCTHFALQGTVNFATAENYMKGKQLWGRSQAQTSFNL